MLWKFVFMNLNGEILPSCKQSQVEWQPADKLSIVADHCPASWRTSHRALHHKSGLLLSLRQANERRRYFVTTSLTGWAQAWNQPCKSFWERDCWWRDLRHSLAVRQDKWLAIPEWTWQLIPGLFRREHDMNVCRLFKCVPKVPILNT